MWEWTNLDPRTNVEVVFDGRGLAPFVDMLPVETVERWDGWLAMGCVGRC